MATYAVGDIQGCFDSFRRLLDLCAFDPASDRLWLVGDLVNRGPRSLETLRFVRDLGEAAVTVLGNHDLYLLMVAEGGAKFRGKDDTLQEILDAPDCGELLHWLRFQRLFHCAGEYGLVHAGLLPQWTAARALELAAEVETALRGPSYRDFILNLWGSEPAAWSDELTGWARLRVIVNAMTRLRFCTPEGVMEFHTKGEALAAPPGHLPWFEVPGRQSAASVLVTGHWSALGLRLLPNLLALDSGCLWGGHLTALRLEDRQVFQVGCSAGEAQPLG
ncbi:MAG: symmetrical bis(5'-nucleosyl)-tetraphosphatase [Azonexus sp.]|jgi:bis(5'-nucleosyl)-tetraphosphatase (symmetrical)|nr:symmetrical bis(5'-nucleosyl)-tetraphosphatase [Betaproteobacteria bacterium]MBK8919333.1 symmetrical bis(5'-nucleosyl)-tetraphosphatase [Betaproteobacteria bacterium]MBP6035263.1 symmetrical bis(5'-nucleosyl)-tetraphosphatase [Azonexus sp.]MBP6905846.1 symmetrical bis(5'-nucleosyl)-tetraphosphatase [Azonexus sp.]